jgi:hypothetical protein
LQAQHDCIIDLFDAQYKAKFREAYAARLTDGKETIARFQSAWAAASKTAGG